MQRSIYLNALAALYEQPLLTTVDLPLPLMRSPAWHARDKFEVALAALAPHVSSRDRLKLLALSRDSCMPAPFAVPAVLLRNCYHLLEFRPSDGLHPECLRYVECVRLPKQPDADNVVIVPQWQARHPYLFVEESLQFARANWGSDLCFEDWSSFATIDLLSSPGSARSARVSSTLKIFLAMRIDLRALLSDDLPGAEQRLEDSLYRVSTDPVEGEELRGNFSHNYVVSCGRCGGRLNQSGCMDCAASFRCLPFRPQTLALSPTLKSIARAAGHRFELFSNGNSPFEAS